MLKQPQRLLATHASAWSLALYALTALTVAGCATQPPGVLTGSALYRERIALPPDAVFEAVLQELVADGAASNTLGRAVLKPAGQPPFRFQIGYDASKVQPGSRYAVSAAVKQQGRLLFASNRTYPVLDGNNAPLNIMLVSASAGGTTGIANLPASYEREVPGANSLMRWHLDLLPEGYYQLRTTFVDKPQPNSHDQIGRWLYDQNSGRLELNRGGTQPPLYFKMAPDGGTLAQLNGDDQPLVSARIQPMRRLPQPAPIEPNLVVTGMFSYMADAASITLCDDGRRLPVDMSGDYRALEQAYVNAKPQPAQPLLVKLQGLIAQRPAAEASQPPQATLIVERFMTISPRETCGQPLANSPLRGTYWKLVRLHDQPVTVANNRQEPHLVFAANEQRVSGSSGCNRVLGGFKLDGDNLQFGQMAGTMMACLSGMDLEQRFLKALSQVARYRIAGSHLEMLDEQGMVLARFEAVALR